MNAQLLLLLAASGAPPAFETLPNRAERPDPLIMLNGSKVATPAQWEQRRTELKELFQFYMYGTWPGEPTNLTTKLLHEDKAAFGGAATLREIEIAYDFNGQTNPAPIRVLITTPNGVSGKVPCFVGMNFQGNAALVRDPKVSLPRSWMFSNRAGVKDNKATEASRGTATDVWPFEAAAKKGYAIATFYCGDVQPDRPNVDEGLRVALKGSDTACIATWAWGISRVVDALVNDPAIDAKKIISVGHSRLGKTALLAGAFDDRIAAVVANQAGCGGSAPSRHSDAQAESVKRITSSFPHWFCGNFANFGDALDKLPFDQHCLVAVCAPRPVLFTNAQADLWANPTGQFEILKAATPVYELLGQKGLTTTTYKSDLLINDRLGYYIRPGKHSMTFQDWDAYLGWADKWVK